METTSTVSFCCSLQDENLAEFSPGTSWGSRLRCSSQEALRPWRGPGRGGGRNCLPVAWPVRISNHQRARSNDPSRILGYLGDCQNYGPLLGTLNIRGRIIIGIQKGTIILTTTHLCSFVGCKLMCGTGFESEVVYRQGGAAPFSRVSCRGQASSWECLVHEELSLGLKV